MKSTKTALLALCLLSILTATPAWANKLKVSWQLPTQNTDGSALTDLATIRVEWGTCVNNDWGVYQGGVNFSPTSTRGTVIETGLNPVCLRVFAINSKNVASAPSPTVVVKFDPAGKPVVLN